MLIGTGSTNPPPGHQGRRNMPFVTLVAIPSLNNLRLDRAMVRQLPENHPVSSSSVQPSKKVLDIRSRRYRALFHQRPNRRVPPRQTLATILVQANRVLPCSCRQPLRDASCPASFPPPFALCIHVRTLVQRAAEAASVVLANRIWASLTELLPMFWRPERPCLCPPFQVPRQE